MSMIAYNDSKMYVLYDVIAQSTEELTVMYQLWAHTHTHTHTHVTLMLYDNMLC